MTAGCFIQCFSRIASGKSGKEFCGRINSYSGRMNPARGVLGFSQELGRFSSVLWSLGRPPALRRGVWYQLAVVGAAQGGLIRHLEVGAQVAPRICLCRKVFPMFCEAPRMLCLASEV